MSDHSLVAAARELKPLIEKRRPEGESQAHLTREIVKACGEAGFFRMTAPKEVGGYEMLPSDVAKVTQIVSSADPAVGWYIQNSIPAGLAAARLEEAARNALFENPNLNFGNGGMPGGTAVSKDEGFRLNGIWPVVTGVEDADWAALVGVVTEKGTPIDVDGHPDARTFLVPTHVLEIKNTWQNVSAMRGTGSNAVAASDVYVPAEFVVAPSSPLVVERNYFAEPLMVHNAPPDAAVTLGVLDTVMTSLVPLLSQQTSAFTGERRRDQAATQELIVACHFKLTALRAALYELTERVGALISNGQTVDDRLRAEIYGGVFQILEEGRLMVSQLYAGGTRDMFVTGHPLAQALNDLHAISYARSAVRFMVYSAGRVLLGGEHDPGL